MYIIHKNVTFTAVITLIFTQILLLLHPKPINMNTDTKSADQQLPYKSIIFSNKEWWILIFLFLFSLIGVFVCTAQKAESNQEFIEMNLN